MQSAQGLLRTAVCLYERAEREGTSKSIPVSRRDNLLNQLCLCAQDIEIQAIAKMTAQQGYAA
jgi:hypothetical protein